MSNKPDIIILVLDTQRADRLSCYGYPFDTTPNLDAFAGEAIRFEHAVAPAQWTVPTHASIFTGEYPRRHNLLQTDSVLTSGLSTLAERLEHAGYFTAGFSQNPLIGAVKNGLDRGFHQFTSFHYKRTDLLTFHLSESVRSRSLSSRLVQSSRTLLADLLGYSQQTPAHHLSPLVLPLWSFVLNVAHRGKEANTANTLQAATHLLVDRPGIDRDQPIFAFINLMGTHVPYEPSEWAAKKFMSPIQGRRATNSLLYRANAWQVNVRNWLELSLPATEVEPLLNACYDAEVAAQDALVGNFLRRLKEAGNFESTFIAVVADHGDHLGERNRVNHAFGVYEPLVWVPLIIHDPASELPLGTTVRDTISTRRLFHTVLATAGAADVREASLTLTNLTGEHELVLTQGVPLAWAVNRLLRDEPDLLAKLGGKYTSQAIYQATYKLIQTGERYELFNRQADPGETNDLSVRLPEMLAQQQSLLQTTVQQLEPPIETGIQDEIAPGIKEHLRNLGYLE